MDMKKIGSFISELRKEKGLTQEQLGEKIGVTNKTVSRWERGTYLPPADILLELSEMYDLTINELLSGKRLSGEEYKKAAENNLKQTITSISFFLKDRIEYYRKKWLKNHIAIMVFTWICTLAVIITGIVMKNLVIIYISILIIIIFHAWTHNSMMAYVENSAFDGSGR